MGEKLTVRIPSHEIWLCLWQKSEWMRAFYKGLSRLSQAGEAARLRIAEKKESRFLRRSADEWMRENEEEKRIGRRRKKGAGDLLRKIDSLWVSLDLRGFGPWYSLAALKKEGEKEKKSWNVNLFSIVSAWERENKECIRTCIPMRLEQSEI